MKTSYKVTFLAILLAIFASSCTKEITSPNTIANGNIWIRRIYYGICFYFCYVISYNLKRQTLTPLPLSYSVNYSDLILRI